MNIAVVHFHFNRGGVTQVVLNQLAALQAVAGDSCRFALLCGGRHNGISDEYFEATASGAPTLHQVAGLDYDQGGPPRPAELAAAMRQALADAGLGPSQTLLHVHNHALGKNVSLPGAVTLLAREGFRLVLQLHDFAEDFRPENYRRLSASLAGLGDASAELYPQAGHIHYAVLNQRDYCILQKAGAEHVHLLPNPIREPRALPAQETARQRLERLGGLRGEQRYFLYPVRGIRRKNLGEALLWSLLGQDAVVIGLTLAPLNPKEQPSYLRWKALARELDLPCVFESGASLSLDENRAAADRVITTSVAEGFGMAFLEPWLFGRALVGRNLPEITSDFAAEGIDLSRLRSALMIPIAWVGRKPLRDAFSTAWQDALQAYGRQVSAQAIRGACEHFLDADAVDYALLSSHLQGQVLRQLRDRPVLCDEVYARNPWLWQSLQEDDDQELIVRNAAAVRRSFCPEVSGQRLLALYREVMAQPIDDQMRALPHSGAILDAYLNINRLHPLRMEP